MASILSLAAALTMASARSSANGHNDSFAISEKQAKVCTQVGVLLRRKELLLKRRRCCTTLCELLLPVMLCLLLVIGVISTNVDASPAGFFAPETTGDALMSLGPNGFGSFLVQQQIAGALGSLGGIAGDLVTGLQVPTGIPPLPLFLLYSFVLQQVCLQSLRWHASARHLLAIGPSSHIFERVSTKYCTFRSFRHKWASRDVSLLTMVVFWP